MAADLILDQRVQVRVLAGERRKEVIELALGLAIVAAVCFFVALFVASLGPVSLVTLGLLFLALSLVAGNLPATAGLHRR